MVKEGPPGLSRYPGEPYAPDIKSRTAFRFGYLGFMSLNNGVTFARTYHTYSLSIQFVLVLEICGGGLLFEVFRDNNKKKN